MGFIRKRTRLHIITRKLSFFSIYNPSNIWRVIVYSQAQPSAAQSFFETNPYYAAAAAAQMQYTAPTSPDFTHSSAAQIAAAAAGISNQGSNSATAAFLAQQQLQQSGFMQVMWPVFYGI